MSGSPPGAAVSPTHTLQCLEVWGGNRSVDRGVAMLGVDAWVYCRPQGENEAGGDVHYVSSCASGRIVRLMVADVSGHGADVADLASRLRTLMRSYVNDVDQTRRVQSRDPSERLLLCLPDLLQLIVEGVCQ